MKFVNVLVPLVISLVASVVVLSYVAWRGAASPPASPCGEEDPRWIPRVPGSKNTPQRPWQCGQVGSCGVIHEIECPRGER